MFEPNDYRQNMEQAINSVRLLASERDLWQIACVQWICGKFTLIDSWQEAGARIEAWYLCNPNRESKDIVLVIGRHTGCAIRGHWAEQWLTEAALSQVDSGYVRVAEKILAYRDRVSRVGQERGK